MELRPEDCVGRVTWVLDQALSRRAGKAVFIQGVVQSYTRGTATKNRFFSVKLVSGSTISTRVSPVRGTLGMEPPDSSVRLKTIVQVKTFLHALKGSQGLQGLMSKGILLPILSVHPLPFFVV
jgi:hypothetical protein